MSVLRHGLSFIWVPCPSTVCVINAPGVRTSILTYWLMMSKIVSFFFSLVFFSPIYFASHHSLQRDFENFWLLTTLFPVAACARRDTRKSLSRSRMSGHQFKLIALGFGLCNFQSHSLLLVSPFIFLRILIELENLIGCYRRICNKFLATHESSNQNFENFFFYCNPHFACT